jgi:hypothetical protein
VIIFQKDITFLGKNNEIESLQLSLCSDYMLKHFLRLTYQITEHQRCLEEVPGVPSPIGWLIVFCFMSHTRHRTLLSFFRAHLKDCPTFKAMPRTPQGPLIRLLRHDRRRWEPNLAPRSPRHGGLYITPVGKIENEKEKDSQNIKSTWWILSWHLHEAVLDVLACNCTTMFITEMCMCYGLFCWHVSTCWLWNVESQIELDNEQIDIESKEEYEWKQWWIY